MKLRHVVVLLACLSSAALAAVQQMPRSVAPEPDPTHSGSLFLAACLVDMASGRTALAETECTKAIQIDPKSAVAYKLRGYAYLIDRNFQSAEADFHVALRLDPEDAESRAGLGQSFNGMHAYEKAVVQFARAVKLEPGSAAYHNGLCWTRAGTRRHLDLALAECNRAMELAPGTPGPLNSRGLVRLRMGRYREAIADYDASLAGRSAQPTARFGRGLAHLRLGEKLAGAADISEALRGDTDIAMLFVHLGLLPRSCADMAKACPPGFPKPATNEKPAYPWLMVSLHGDPDEDYALTIEAHRLELMVTQSARLLGRRDVMPSEPAQTHRQILDRLEQTVVIFNRLLPQACARLRMRPENCQAFRPTWTAVTDPAVAVREAYTRMTPVWAGLCGDRARQCRIE